MKKLLIFALALVMALSLSVGMAVPVAAEPDVVFSNYSEASGDYDAWNDTSPSPNVIEEFTTEDAPGQWDITGIRLSAYGGGILGGGSSPATVRIYTDAAGTSIVSGAEWNIAIDTGMGEDFSFEVTGVTLDANAAYWFGLEATGGTSNAIGWESDTPFPEGEPIPPHGHVFELTGNPAPEPTPTPDGEGCFIATAAYGTASAAEIDTLRAFRDEVLLQNSLGSQLVARYYEVSPPVADFISGNSFLKTLVRELVIDPMVSVATFTQGIWGK